MKKLKITLILALSPQWRGNNYFPFLDSVGINVSSGMSLSMRQPLFFIILKFKVWINEKENFYCRHHRRL
jgi:hypothetical protein